MVNFESYFNEGDLAIEAEVHNKLIAKAYPWLAKKYPAWNPAKRVTNPAFNPYKRLVWILMDIKTLGNKKKLLRDIEPYMNEFGKKDRWLYRGMKEASLNKKSRLIKVRQDRKPVDTNKEFNDVINKEMQKLYGFSRENSLFTSPNEAFAGNYGSVKLIFPVGDYQYIWSEVYEDFYSDFDVLIFKIMGWGNHIEDIRTLFWRNINNVKKIPEWFDNEELHLVKDQKMHRYPGGWKQAKKDLIEAIDRGYNLNIMFPKIFDGEVIINCKEYYHA